VKDAISDSEPDTIGAIASVLLRAGEYITNR